MTACQPPPVQQTHLCTFYTGSAVIVLNVHARGQKNEKIFFYICFCFSLEEKVFCFMLLVMVGFTENFSLKVDGVFLLNLNNFFDNILVYFF